MPSEVLVFKACDEKTRIQRTVESISCNAMTTQVPSSSDVLESMILRCGGMNYGVM